MSNIVINNNSVVFGPQSPLHRVVSDAGLKEKLTRMIVDTSTTVYRKRAFDTYMLANSIFPNKVAEVNDNVKHAIGKLIEAFNTNNIHQVHDVVMKTPKQKYAQGEIFLTNEIAKATGVKNTLVMIVDSEKESITAGHGIITYITRGMTNGVCAPLEAGWTNKFFNFKDPDHMGLLIVIPKQYISSLITHTLPDTNPVGVSSVDSIAFKGDLVNNFTMDLIKSFFSAIYSDGIRTRVNSDIILLNNLLQKEGSIATAIASDTGNRETASETFVKHTVELKQFKSSGNNEHFVYELLKFAEFKNITLNPFDFYKGFIDVPYCQIENVFAKIPSISRFTDGQYTSHNFSNNLSDMDIFFEDKDRDVIVYGMKLVRFLPFLLFNTYVLGGGSQHNEVKTILGSVKTFITSLLSFRASNAYSAPIVRFIADNLDYIMNDFYSQISSPLSVTSSSRSAITIAIGKYGVALDPEGSDTLEGVVNATSRLI